VYKTDRQSSLTYYRSFRRQRIQDTGVLISFRYILVKYCTLVDREQNQNSFDKKSQTLEIYM